MELLEMIGWIAVGFIPTYGALAMVNRKLMAVRRSLIESLGGEQMK